MPAQGVSTYGTSRKLGQAKTHEISIISNYKLSYRNREDVTNTAPGVLIVGSQNVFTNVSDRVQIRQGYALDGATSVVASPILASFDFFANFGERNLRAGFLTSAGNDGKLQYRYVDTSGAVTWRDLITGATSVNYNFCTFWNITENTREVLFVNGASQIQSWNGAITTIVSTDNTAGHIAIIAGTPTAGGSGYTVGDILTITTGGTGGTVTVTSVTGGVVTGVTLTTVGSGYTTGTGKATSGGTGTGATINITNIATGQLVASGASNLALQGFYGTTNLILTINGTNYTYAYIVGNSFLGINATAEANASIVIQTVVLTLNTSTTGLLTSTFANGLISNLNNQIYLGSLNSSVFYISKVGSYTDYTFSSPRVSGEGYHQTLDANLVAFEPQENFMYISCGTDLWYNVAFQVQTSTVGVTYEQVNALPLTTGRQQGAMSQAFVSHMKNDIIVVTNEPTIDTFGRIETSLATPQQTNISDSIKLDVDNYDFTDGSIFYFKYVIYVAVPKEGLVLTYDLNTKSWNTPFTLPVSRFYIVGGELYGHSYNTSESYQLFTGYADRVYPGFAGYPIDAKWVFSYQDFGTRTYRKSANMFYVEGYISANTIVNATITYEVDGCKTMRTFTIDGSDTQIVCIPVSEGSLGKESLGKQKLGGAGNSSIQGLPPKFRVIKTFNNTDFFEVSISFEVLGTDNRMELLAFGLNAIPATQNAVKIRQ